MVYYLTKFLIDKHIKKSSITILSAYEGQIFEIKKKLSENQIKEVNVSTIDRFQGDEADIIILSLVRSNKENKIGFLSKANRIIVSLSRAKMVFFSFL